MVSSEKKRLGVEGGADRWGLPVGVKRKRKRKKSRERGCGLRPAGLARWLGRFASGWPSWLPDPFFKNYFLLSFILFYFLLFFISFAFFTSNHFKPKRKIFYKSKEQYETVNNMIS
jgi:hypothetical protein